MIHRNKVPSLEIMLLVGGCVLLIIVQLIYNRPPFYDEDDYLANVAALHQFGLGSKFLLHLEGSAGPLYPVIHYLLEPLTGLQTPFIRWVNIGFLAGIIYLTYQTLLLFKPVPAMFSLYMLAVPMLYVIAGLALTEMPAMFFFSLAIYLVIKNSINRSRYFFAHIIIAGLSMGLCISGRQPFLVTLVAFPILFFVPDDFQKGILPLAIFLLCSLALPCYVFTVWKGFVPVIESHLYADIASAGTTYRFDFFLLCVFYFAVSMALVAPRFFLLPLNRVALIALVTAFAAIAIANVYFGMVRLEPLKGFMEKFFVTPGQISLLSGLCGTAVICAALYFMVCTIYQLRRPHLPGATLFFAVSLLLLAITCIRITWGFSSRYAGQGIPLLVLFGSFFYRPSKFNAPRIGIGIATGLISILSYFAGK